LASAVILARGLHAPWATGIASLGRLLVERLASSRVYDDIRVIVKPDWHRVRGSLDDALEGIRRLGVEVEVVGGFPRLARFPGADVYVLAERVLGVGARSWKFFYVRPPSALEAFAARLAAGAARLLTGFVVTQPGLARVYGVSASVLPPVPWYVDSWGSCRPGFDVPEPGGYALYIGWARPERLPLEFLESLASGAGLPVVVVGRESEGRYGEASYLEVVRSRVPGVVAVNRALRDCEKRWLIENARVLVFPARGRLNPPVVEPPLVVLEALRLGTPVLAYPGYGLEWVASYCDGLGFAASGGFSLPRRVDCSRFWALAEELWRGFVEGLQGG